MKNEIQRTLFIEFICRVGSAIIGQNINIKISGVTDKIKSNKKVIRLDSFRYCYAVRDIKKKMFHVSKINYFKIK